ncbi:hypothetical protein [Burkholderia sp. 22313]|uniref:hypothetical protein n=1 Tax=Burkholderia sp. 22313 TaxID=3453908 RepID=UPI003F873D4C
MRRALNDGHDGNKARVACRPNGLAALFAASFRLVASVFMKAHRACSRAGNVEANRRA